MLLCLTNAAGLRKPTPPLSSTKSPPLACGLRLSAPWHGGHRTHLTRPALRWGAGCSHAPFRHGWCRRGLRTGKTCRGSVSPWPCSSRKWYGVRLERVILSCARAVACFLFLYVHAFAGCISQLAAYAQPRSNTLASKSKRPLARAAHRLCPARPLLGL